MQPTDHTSTMKREILSAYPWQVNMDEQDGSRHTGFGVILETKHDFGCTIPSCCNVLGHITGILVYVVGETSGETKVANLQFAVGVDQQVAWLQISMQDVG